MARAGEVAAFRGLLGQGAPDAEGLPGQAVSYGADPFAASASRGGRYS